MDSQEATLSGSARVQSQPPCKQPDSEQPLAHGPQRQASGKDYAGYGPATVEMFRDLWRRQVKEETRRAESSKKGMTLFPM